MQRSKQHELNIGVIFLSRVRLMLVILGVNLLQFARNKRDCLLFDAFENYAEFDMKGQERDMN